MIKYSKRALKAFVYLFRPYNDLDVYVEDTANRNMYEVLLTRMLPHTTRVRRVIQLGGKNEVLEACRNDQSSGGRPRLYVVDGDLEILLGIPPPRLKHLYCLSVYASENLVFSELAVTEVAYECLPNSSKVEAARIVAFDRFVNGIIPPLARLFAFYAVVYAFNKEIVTVGYNVMKLCQRSGKYHGLSTKKVNARIDDMREALTGKMTPGELEQSLSGIEARMGTTAIERARFISGKSYLFPLLIHHLQATVRFAGTIEQLKVRLARFVRVDIDDGLNKAVNQAAKGIH